RDAPRRNSHDAERRATILLQLLDRDIAKLHKARRPAPAALLLVPAAMMLERDRAFFGHAGELGVADDLFAVELHPETVAFHRDLEGVPLAARAIHLLLRRDAGTNLGDIFLSVR